MAVQQQLDKLTDLVRDHIIGMSVIRAFNRSHDEKNAEIQMFSDLSAKETKLARTYAIGLPTILIIFNMSTVVILWIGGYQIDSGVLQIGDIMAIIEYATLILMNLIMAVFVLLDVPEALICYGRIQELLRHAETTVTRQNTVSTAFGQGRQNTQAHHNSACSDSHGHAPLLEFRHVTFRYDDAEEAALKDISFTLEAGETLAVMGDIGSGKSTLAKLMLGLYPIESGDILFDGKSIFLSPWNPFALKSATCRKSVPLHGLHCHELSLRQAPRCDGARLFEELEEAAKLAGAHEFISRLTTATIMSSPKAAPTSPAASASAWPWLGP